MSQLTLFTDSRFPCPQRLHLVITELGLPLRDTIELDILKREQKDEKYASLNPTGAVPFLRDDATQIVLSESRAIARYLVSQYGYSNSNLNKPPLLPEPTQVKEMAEFEEAASIEVTAFDANANPLVLEEHFKPLFFQQEPDKDVAKRLRDRVVHYLDMADRRLSNRVFMAGQNMTLVDLFYVPYMHHLVTTVMTDCLESRPSLGRWWNRMIALDSYKSVMLKA